MPTYEFEDEAGVRVDLYLAMSEAPGYGEWRDFGGRRLRRMVESSHVPPFVPDFECVVRSQARWDPAAPRYDERGHAVILNKREHENYKAKKNQTVVWD